MTIHSVFIRLTGSFNSRIFVMLLVLIEVGINDFWLRKQIKSNWMARQKNGWYIDRYFHSLCYYASIPSKNVDEKKEKQSCTSEFEYISIHNSESSDLIYCCQRSSRCSMRSNMNKNSLFLIGRRHEHVECAVLLLHVSMNML